MSIRTWIQKRPRFFFFFFFFCGGGGGGGGGVKREGRIDNNSSFLQDLFSLMYNCKDKLLTI